MEGFLLIESLDSLWFSNLFSSRAGTGINLSAKKITNDEDPEKLSKPVVHGQQNESLEAEFLSPRKDSFKPIVHGQQKVDHFPPKCTKCGEIAVKIESPPNPTEMVVSEENAKSEFWFRNHAGEEDRSDSSSKRKKKSKRNIKGELLDFGFDDNWTFLRNHGAREIGHDHHLMKMPPLSDGMAMKAHLKSWAYAVACTIIDECMFRFNSKMQSLI